MRHLFILMLLGGVSLLLSMSAQAQGCFELVGGATECDSCGYYQDTLVCKGFQSSGGQSCNPLFYQLPCSSPDRSCQGLFPSAQLIGHCGSEPTKANAQLELNAPIEIELLSAVFIPNREGGYDNAATFGASCSSAGVGR